MKKYVLIFLFLLGATAVMAQKKPLITVKKKSVATAKKTSLVILQSSETADYTKDATGSTLAKVHKGVFQQDFSTLTSDSAYFHPDQNMVDAFGRVHITQGDTLNIYSDKLNYDGNTKLAILTGHVIMIDKDARLTTDYLTYNTATRIAIYNDGGKLVNKDNTLTSKNGYYFALTRDAYFRYNVVCITPDALIKTDTLKYNTGVRIAYFYGPTHIYGTKDKDTLYTENGTYNTITEQARFGKNNLYTQGTKSLKGDSLFYDRLKGYGRAVKHVTFNDNEQKLTMKGDLGEYYKADDRALVTQNAYMIIVTEEKDTTQTDSVAKKVLTPLKTDSLSKKVSAQNKPDPLTVKRLGLVPAAKIKTDSVTIKRLGLSPAVKPKVDSAAIKRAGLVPAPKPKVDSATLKRLGLVPATPKAKPVVTKNGNTTAKTRDEKPLKKKDEPVISPAIAKVSDHIKRDSLFIGGDSLETQILTYKDLKILQRERWEASNRDTSIKVFHSVILTKPPKVLTLASPRMLVDTGLYHPEFFGKPKPKAIAKKKPLKPADAKKATLDSIKSIRVADSLQKIADHGLTDTSRIRIITVHHHAKIFKSDLQAKSDSMFYSYSDSTIRMFNKPMIWTQGSQLSGDTINLQMKNRQLDNMDLYPSALVVNIEKNDSTHFNQAGGKTMHGTFKDNKLASMLVVGNAETIAFNRDSATNKVTDMERSVSGSIYVIFKNGEVKRGTFFKKYENVANNITKVKEEDKTLKNFIWKPKDRPASKQDIIAGYKPPVEKKAPGSKSTPVKGAMPVKTAGNKKQNGKTSTKPVTGNQQAKDTTSLTRPDTLKKPPVIKTTIWNKPIIYN